MSKTIRVAVSGAGGRMGRETVNAVLETAPELTLVGAADPAFSGKTISEAVGGDSRIVIEKNVGDVLAATKADVVVVFTVPAAAMDDIRRAMQAEAVPVVGTTGITADNLEEINSLALKHRVGAIIAPNFAIGAILMMRLAKEAAKYLPAVEIIELHHDRKLDAPSGTAIKTAELIASARRETYEAIGDEPARGGDVNGIRVHSLRLPGLVAHQEVIFGAPGQTLTIRHDSFDRKSFMPGVVIAVKKAYDLKEVIYGLENLI